MVGLATLLPAPGTSASTTEADRDRLSGPTLLCMEVRLVTAPRDLAAADAAAAAALTVMAGAPLPPAPAPLVKRAPWRADTLPEAAAVDGLVVLMSSLREGSVAQDTL